MGKKQSATAFGCRKLLLLLCCRNDVSLTCQTLSLLLFHTQKWGAMHRCQPPPHRAFHFHEKPWWVRQLSPVRPDEMVNYWLCSQRLHRFWNNKYRSVTLSGRVVKGEFVVHKLKIFKRSLQRRPCNYPIKQPISSKSLHECPPPQFFFPVSISERASYFMAVYISFPICSPQQSSEITGKNNMDEFHCRVANESKALSMK